MDGMVLRIGGHDWHCIAGYGHAPEHIALHCPALGLLISGDMVLPRISTNVSVIDLEPEANPLPLYLARSSGCARCRPTRWCCPRTASPSPACTRASTNCSSTTTSVGRGAAGLRPAPAQRGRAAAGAVQAQLDLHQTTFAMGEADRPPARAGGAGAAAGRWTADSGCLRWRTC
jgi:hypothetical protein